MKKFILLILLLNTMIGIAQYPQLFNYQAVARDEQGNVIKNKQIAVEISILKGNNCINTPNNCQLLWQEIHFPTTNQFGLFNIEIGNGQNTYAGSLTNFSQINWNDFTGGNYYMKIRVDFGNSNLGNSMMDIGVVKFLSVPYSLATKDVARDTNGKLPFNLNELSDVNINNLTTNQILQWNGNNWINVDANGGTPISLNDLTDVIINSPSNGQALTFNGTNWTNAQLSINELSDVSILTPTADQVIMWNGSQWQNANISLNNLTDVSISTPNNGEALVWNGTNWTNQNISSGSSPWQQNGATIFYKNGNVGIDTVANYKFQVFSNDNSSILFSGNLNSSYTQVPDANTINFWFNIPKSAFYVGSYTASQWNNVGTYSVSFGSNNQTPAVYSFAFGTRNQINGDYGIAIGDSNIVNGYKAVAIGKSLKPEAFMSLVIGRYNYSSLQNPTTWYGTNQIFVIGNGNNETNRHNAFVIRKDGTVQAQGTITASTADPQKSKKIDNIIAKIMKINPVEENKNGKITYGFTYQNMKKLFPNLLYEFNKNEHTFAYDRMVPILVKAIQEQQLMIKDLQLQNQKLSERLTELERQITELKTNSH